MNASRELRAVRAETGATSGPTIHVNGAFYMNA
jgi:hypothetical protein